RGRTPAAKGDARNAALPWRSWAAGESLVQRPPSPGPSLRSGPPSPADAGEGRWSISLLLPLSGRRACPERAKRVEGCREAADEGVPHRPSPNETPTLRATATNCPAGSTYFGFDTASRIGTAQMLSPRRATILPTSPLAIRSAAALPNRVAKIR